MELWIFVLICRTSRVEKLFKKRERHAYNNEVLKDWTSARASAPVYFD